MTDNLRYELKANVVATGSYSNGTTFSFTPTSCATEGACAINGNTVSTDNGWVYSGYAAYAGKSTSDAGNFNGSICPAGWMLPGGTDDVAEHSTYGLLNAYGVAGLPMQGTAAIAKVTGLPLSFAGKLYQYGGDNGSAAYITKYRSTDSTRRNVWYFTDFIYYRATGSMSIGASIRCTNI